MEGQQQKQDTANMIGCTLFINPKHFLCLPWRCCETAMKCRFKWHVCFIDKQLLGNASWHVLLLSTVSAPSMSYNKISVLSGDDMLQVKVQSPVGSWWQWSASLVTSGRPASVSLLASQIFMLRSDFPALHMRNRYLPAGCWLDQKSLSTMSMLSSMTFSTFCRATFLTNQRWKAGCAL